MSRMRMLKRFVRESNAIEGIEANRGDPLFDRHLKAVRLVDGCVRTRKLINPIDIHTTLLPGISGYRTCEVDIVLEETGEIVSTMPPYKSVPELMASWERSCERWRAALVHMQTLHSSHRHPYWETWARNRAQVLHDWLLCIHPFQDDNGRIARLFFNSFLRYAGLPWHTFTYKEQSKDCERTVYFKNYIFNGWYSDRPWAKELKEGVEKEKASIA